MSAGIYVTYIGLARLNVSNLKNNHIELDLFNLRMSSYKKHISQSNLTNYYKSMFFRELRKMHKSET